MGERGSDRAIKPAHLSDAKRALRYCARAIFRLLRPVLLPIAFRGRTFLTALIRDDLQRAQQQLADHIERRLQITANTLILENKRLVAGLHQATQASREAILEDISFHRDALAETVISQMASRLDRIEQLSYASARRVAVHSDPGTILVRTEVGYVLCAESDHAVLVGLLDAGELERGTRLFLERFLRAGDVFVDVGAHLGLLSLAAARAMNGEGKIFAFEPFPQTRRMLEQSLRINGFGDIARVVEAAVSDREGRSTLFLGQVSGHHSILPLSGNADPIDRVEVPVVTLDAALPPHQAITLMKIDVEGAELSVVQGAISVQRSNPDIALIVEFGLTHLQRAGHSVEQWFDVFEQHGYVFRAIDADTGELYSVSRSDLIAEGSCNLFFAKPASSAWSKVGITV